MFRASPPIKVSSASTGQVPPNFSKLPRLANPMEHEPRGLLSDMEIARDFIATDSVLAIDYQPHRDQPLVKRERTILEDRADLDRELATVMGLAAFPQAARGQEAHSLSAADWARNAIRPAEFSEQAERAVRIGEVADRFHQGLGPCDSFVHAPNLIQECAGESSRLLP